MKNTFRILLLVLLVVAVLSVGAWTIGTHQTTAFAATDNPSAGSSGYQIITFGPYASLTATQTGAFKLKLPWPVRIINFSAAASDVANSPTINLKNSAGTSLLTSALTISTVASEATFTTGVSRDLADESTITVDLSTLGTGTANNVTGAIVIKRR